MALVASIVVGLGVWCLVLWWDSSDEKALTDLGARLKVSNDEVEALNRKNKELEHEARDLRVKKEAAEKMLRDIADVVARNAAAGGRLTCEPYLPEYHGGCAKCSGSGSAPPEVIVSPDKVVQVKQHMPFPRTSTAVKPTDDPGAL